MRILIGASTALTPASLLVLVILHLFATVVAVAHSVPSEPPSTSSSSIPAYNKLRDSGITTTTTSETLTPPRPLSPTVAIAATTATSAAETLSSTTTKNNNNNVDDNSRKVDDTTVIVPPPSSHSDSYKSVAGYTASSTGKIISMY